MKKHCEQRPLSDSSGPIRFADSAAHKLSSYIPDAWAGKEEFIYHGIGGEKCRTPPPLPQLRYGLSAVLGLGTGSRIHGQGSTKSPHSSPTDLDSPRKTYVGGCQN